MMGERQPTLFCVEVITIAAIIPTILFGIPGITNMKLSIPKIIYTHLPLVIININGPGQCLIGQMLIEALRWILNW
jgi:hypothetical protein